MSLLATPDFWVALFQIMMINIVLSGDNAVVIALACRALPPAQQKKAIVFGSVGAIVLRIVLTFFAIFLLTLPYLKLIGAGLLLWIGIGLLKGEDDEAELEGHSNLAAAIKTIIVADLVMSLDNVIAVAAVAKDSFVLLILGLAISIPLVIFGATMLMKLMGRWPIIITIGAALIGYVAGEMLVTDPAVIKWFTANAHWMIDFEVVSILGAKLELSAAGLIGVAIVVAAGKWLAARAEAGRREVVDLGEGSETKAPH
jgi:YjbE family integral membrane protein